ncbi:hypothetical protein [Bacillus thuringiensis]|uniref:hypothetical protein n=1 Tax=Bacillus thuringiensis TaxID=1428 RepID=UPI0034593729
MINKLEVAEVNHVVEEGSVIYTQSESGSTKYTYLVVSEGGNQVRLIDLERGYLFSQVLETDGVIKHITSLWDEEILRVFKPNEIQLTEAN